MLIHPGSPIFDLSLCQAVSDAVQAIRVLGSPRTCSGVFWLVSNLSANDFRGDFCLRGSAYDDEDSAIGEEGNEEMWSWVLSESPSGWRLRFLVG